MTPADVGGLFLIIGAIFTYRGEIQRAVMSYFIADGAWIMLAVQSGDTRGTVFIVVGTLLGLGAFIKMNGGTMRKTLNW